MNSTLLTAPPRVLICTADVGCGHGRAANALMMALRTVWPGIEVRQIDALSLTSTHFNRVYRDAYLLAAKHVPRFTGWLYRTSDRPGIAGERGLGVSLETWALRKLIDEPLVRSADLIVCTHFLCARVLSCLRARREIDTPLAVVVTDQHPHAVWRVEHADLYLVPSESAVSELSRHGIPPFRSKATGIPIDARFARPITRGVARRRHGIASDAQVTLITGGGLGLGGLDRALEGVLSVARPTVAVTVCGRNEALYRRLKQRYGVRGDVQIVGLTNRMHEYMAAADVMVGKAGGLTTSEVTAVGLPMVLLRPLPGQEERNAEVLVRSGAAVLHPDPFEAGRVAARLFDQPATLAQMRRSAAAFGRPGSAAAAAEAVLQLIGRAPPMAAADIAAGAIAAGRFN